MRRAPTLLTCLAVVAVTIPLTLVACSPAADNKASSGDGNAADNGGENAPPAPPPISVDDVRIKGFMFDKAILMTGSGSTLKSLQGSDQLGAGDEFVHHTHTWMVANVNQDAGEVTVRHKSGLEKKLHR
ncbi:MAG: hypothetical protein AB7K09_04645 [Planctomycetota bacterium]